MNALFRTERLADATLTVFPMQDRHHPLSRQNERPVVDQLVADPLKIILDGRNFCRAVILCDLSHLAIDNEIMAGVEIVGWPGVGRARISVRLREGHHQRG